MCVQVIQNLFIQLINFKRLQKKNVKFQFCSATVSHLDIISFSIIKLKPCKMFCKIVLFELSR